MTTNVLYRDDVALKENDAISASNRISFIPWVTRIISTRENHSTGQLQEKSIKSYGSDLVQNIDNGDTIAKIIKPSSTEIAQVNATTVEMDYNRSVIGVELQQSALKGANLANAKAKLTNDLYKLWDIIAYTGGSFNTGVQENPFYVQMSPLPITNVNELNAAITAGYENMKSLIGLSDDDAKDVTVGYTSGISPIMSVIFDSTGEASRKIIKEAWPTIDLGQIPSSISGDEDFIELYYRPATKLDHGALPGLYSTESQKHGLGVDELHVFETAKVSFFENGAVIRIPASSVPAQAQAQSK